MTIMFLPVLETLPGSSGANSISESLWITLRVSLSPVYSTEK